jgi:hypothetical protein
MIIVSTMLTTTDKEKLEAAGHIVVNASPTDVILVQDNNVAPAALSVIEALNKWGVPKLVEALLEASQKQ